MSWWKYLGGFSHRPVDTKHFSLGRGWFFPTWRFISANDGALGLYDGGGSSFRLGLGSGSNQRLTIRTHHIPLEILEVLIRHRGDGWVLGIGEGRISSIYRQQIVSHIPKDV